jgi:hypothetical protein
MSNQPSDTELAVILNQVLAVPGPNSNFYALDTRRQDQLLQCVRAVRKALG